MPERHDVVATPSHKKALTTERVGIREPMCCGRERATIRDGLTTSLAWLSRHIKAAAQPPE